MFTFVVAAFHLEQGSGPLLRFISVFNTFSSRGFLFFFVVSSLFCLCCVYPFMYPFDFTSEDLFTLLKF